MRWRRSTWRGGSWRTFFAISLDETTVDRRVEGARICQDLGARAARAQNELAIEAFRAKKLPRTNWQVRARLPKGRRDRAGAKMKPAGQKNGSHADGPDVGHAPAGGRPAHRMGLYLRRHLSAPGQGRRAVMCLGEADAMQRTSSRSVPPVDSRRPCGADRRSGRLALSARSFRDPNDRTVLRISPDRFRGSEPGGYLAAPYARQLVSHNQRGFDCTVHRQQDAISERLIGPRQIGSTGANRVPDRAIGRDLHHNKLDQFGAPRAV